jgi:DNA-binding NarL/FixJ family response regulator
MRELILDTLADKPGIEIVGEVTAETEITNQVNKTSPDLVVIALDNSGKRPNLCDEILHEHPQVRILAVASRESRSVCYWASFDIHSDDVDPSEAGILNAVRSIAAGVN